MVFSSLIFLYAFLPLSMLLYFVVPEIRVKNLVLLMFSLLFYAWGEPVYIFLMLFSILVNYLLGRLMEDEPAKKKHTLVFAVFINLLTLGFFKYYGFAVSGINVLFRLQLPVRELPLPIGISFYTFQALSYLIDLYRGKYRAQKNFLSFALYISMYFQLIAGPIVRYEQVERQLNSRRLTAENLGKGLARFVLGLGKKVLIANVLGALFDRVSAMDGTLTTASAWLGIAAYTLQIYFDFSAYSDMAIGLGKACGFDFPENFNQPYLSKSVTEFWRRWHISLGSWFREYVYIPLGGNRVKPWRHVLNILIVWALTGLWHGADISFVLWGLYYALLLIFEKYVLKKPLPGPLKYIYTMLAVMLGWALFSAGNLTEGLRMLSSMCGFAPGGLADTEALYLLRSYGAWLLAGTVLVLPLGKKLRDRLLSKSRFALAAASLVILLLSTAFLVTENYNPFLYFRF